MSGSAQRKIDRLEREVRSLTALLWVVVSQTGTQDEDGEKHVHVLKSEFELMPRGAILEQKRTSVGVKVIVRDKWRDVVKAAFVGRVDLEGQALFKTGDTQNAE